VVQIWQGTTPDGYALLVERDEDGRWAVTVASVSRSRSESLELALLEAGGGSVTREWAARLAAGLARRAPTTVSHQGSNTARKVP
jgi:hypothetical protein